MLPVLGASADSQTTPRVTTIAAAPHLTPPAPVSVPFYGHESTVESGGLLDDYYGDNDDDEYSDDEEHAYEYHDDSADEFDLDDEFYPDDLGIMWPSPLDNSLANGAATPGQSGPSIKDNYRASNLGLPLSLPYEVESLQDMDERLELIASRLAACVKAREWTTGVRIWSASLQVWMSMGYPMKRKIRINLVFMFYEMIFLPGMNRRFIEDRANDLISLLNTQDLNIDDLRIPWRPLFDALYNQLFPHPQKLKRHTYNLAPCYLNVAEIANKFFHPAEVDDMLAAIMPLFDPDMNILLATQMFLVHFLPPSTCPKWLPLLFRMWYGMNSGLWDDQAADLLGQLAVFHCEPKWSDPVLLQRTSREPKNTPEEDAKNPQLNRLWRRHCTRILNLEDGVVEDDDGITQWADPALLPPEDEGWDRNWKGFRKDVGIFTEQEFEFVMSKTLRSLNVPVGGKIANQNSMSINAADTRTSKKITDSKKPLDRTQSLAEVIIWSMAEDSPIAPVGTAAVPTRSGTPADNHSTPVPPNAGPVARVKNGLTPMSRSGSSDSLAAAGERIEASKKYLAGSKALDSLATLIRSIESFFHPSNSGPWSPFLTCFLAHLTNNFVARWKAQLLPSCTVPMEWRLTPEIKREFVLCLRPVALTAMFNREMDSAQPAITVLRRLAILEPDLIMPAIMQRAVPSLQGLEETQRTQSVTYAVAALAAPFAGRRLWRFGGLYLADIFTLLLPGIDLNDPTKTGLTCMAIVNMVDHIAIGDISEVDESSALAVTPGARNTRQTPWPTTDDDPNDLVATEFEDLSPEEVESRIRMSTTAFRDWVPEFLGRVLLLFANLPEEGGKSGRAGGRTELLTLQSVLHTCGAIFGALDDKLFDVALDQIVEYITTTTRSNAVDVAGELVRNLAAANANKTFARIFPIARQRIIAELKAGASSTRTMTTSIPRPSDAPLHWWLSILHGLLVPGRLNLTEYRAEYMDLLRTMVHSTYSERGWRWTGKVIEKTLSCLTAHYLTEMHFLNKEDREGQDFKLNHTMYWGKLYRSAHAHPEWRRITDADVDMALEVISLADDAVTTLHGLLDTRTGDHVWINDFGRALSVIDEVLIGCYSLIEDPANKEKSPIKSSDTEAYNFPDQLVHGCPPFKAGFVLTDPADPRHQKVMAFRQRTGEMLNRASTILRTAGDSDNSIDCVKLLLSAIGSFLVSYGIGGKRYTQSSQALEALAASKRLYEGQSKATRAVFCGTATVHHSNRLMTGSYNRWRTPLDDKLILSVLEFCLSPFVRIRRRAQAHFDRIAKCYRDCFMLTQPVLFDALKPGNDPDRIKGALYVLRTNNTGIARICMDWVGMVEYLDLLLDMGHEPKASIQTLVHKAIDDTINKFPEPALMRCDVGLEAVDKATDEVIAVLPAPPAADFVHGIEDGSRRRLEFQDKQYDVNVDHVLAKAADPALNWRYQMACARLLYALVRRDRPTDSRLLDFFLKTVSHPHPRLRDYGIAGVNRVLFQATMRTFCQGDYRRLLEQNPVDPFVSTVDLTTITDGPGYFKEYIASFLEEPSEESVLHDRPGTGWLCWGKEMEVSRFSKWDEQIWHLEPACQPAMEAVITAVADPEWWKKLSDFWSQEETRNYPSSAHIDFILMLCQVVGRPVLDQIKPLVESIMADMDEKKVYDRHVYRAMWEFLSGLLRGTWEWPGRDRKDFWDWFTPLLPELLRMVRSDTVKVWDTSLEYVLNEQDPRRYKPLVDFMLDSARTADFHADSAFELYRRVQMPRSILRCQRWHAQGLAPELTKLFFSNLDCPYTDIRSIIGSILNALDLFQWNTSFPSAEVMLSEVMADTTGKIDIMGLRHPALENELKATIANMQELVKVRPAGPTASQSAYDATAETIMHWMAIQVSDFHAPASFPHMMNLMSELFKMREMKENYDMMYQANRLLAWITSLTPPFELVEPLMMQLINILQETTSWRTKISALPVLSLTYFRSLSLLSEPIKAKCLEVVSLCLKDPNLDVREMAGGTLNGFLRCSQRSMVLVLKDRFVRDIERIKLPRRTLSSGAINPAYQSKIVELHAAILGVVAIIEAFPYTVPTFVPPLLADTLAPKVSEPMPISGTIRKCIASFKRTHEKYQERMTEDELASMNYAQAGNSYYA